MEILGVAKVSGKFLITLPKEVREHLGVKEGDRVVFIKKDSEVIIRNAKQIQL